MWFTAIVVARKPENLRMSQQSQVIFCDALIFGAAVPLRTAFARGEEMGSGEL